ncbi:Cof-type HAD-IIB family hydrolase [Flavobacterium sp. CS20]|uniref:Cof-type HAD-IIB family hydrolase n=1 Tax=Flavobacterium sp. CS20 TaxID=2775246 RepID=UPI001B39D203|nr:Cof-type HAD-IIB family hydrolase [Flavobacterium sp. CS20]QTY27635.1 HAD family phosphatase [Flavobacterium sp. CS20]
MMYQLIAIDIDGTLLDKNKGVSNQTIKTINALKQKAKIVLISAQMPKAMRHLQDDLGISNFPIVAYNGGLVLHQDKILSHTGIDFNTFREVLNANQDLNLHISLYHNDEWFAPQEDEWCRREVANTKVHPEFKSNNAVFEDWKIHNKEPHKIMCMGDERKVEEFYQRLSHHLQDKLHLYRSKPTYIEMAPMQISKLSGLQVLLQKIYKDIKLEQVVAYGDNYNDIEMIDKVGLGVAVDNARLEVKAVADDITQSNIDHGVANHLQKIFDIKL